ncbi:Lrp/AsnC family transcriptional regulator [Parahaliea mediterranea]|uniref:Lrp/AsnC family transcriptional regulator n=1 Tax=Parahaliea mediterranea TaxID=651086 RepID=A0A939INB7_9GAMM|nr:Lrp/AsnC family transcriptional regulator [Parahaliea mediterranea]MBN7797943.1 Lrp/AsnC family transcriptional regulator [Parahaliea mediterranea]
MKALDHTDRQLINLLTRNARASTSALARALGVSRSTVQDRIARLEQRQIIEGYTLRFNDGFDQRQLRAHVMIQVNPKQGQRVEAALQDMEAVKTLQTVSGVFDLVTSVQTATTEEMDIVLDGIRALPGVEKTTTSIVLTTKFRR